MNRIKILAKILILTIIFSSCTNKNDNKKTESQTQLEKTKLTDKVFTESEIAKYTISAIMNQSPEIVNVSENSGIYYISYTRTNDGQEFKYKIKINGEKVTWGNIDGRWRNNQLDGKINYSEKDSILSIIQTFEDGSEVIKEFKKIE